jgi:hypothetical protein
MKKQLIVIPAIAAALMLPACSASTMQAGDQGVIVEDYVMIATDPEVIGCMAPETSEYFHSKKVYKYPSRQISWDASEDGNAGPERGPYIVTSNAKAPTDMKIPVTVTFDLTTDCEKLKAFHRDFGTKYQGWINDNTDGWVKLLNYVVGQPMEQALISVAQQYEWREIWNDEKVRIAFIETLRKQLPEAAKARTDGQAFFENFQVTVGKPTPVDDGLKSAIVAEQTAIANARAAEAKGTADANARKAAAVAELDAAIAETKTAEQEALKRQAEARGYGSPEDYLKALAIKQGLNPYQPTYVVPQGGR